MGNFPVTGEMAGDFVPTTKEAQAEAFTPPLRVRIARWLGFRYHLGEEPEVPPDWAGWMVVTDLKMKFDVRNRLRLLVNGKLTMRLVQYSRTEVKEVKNRFDYMIG